MTGSRKKSILIFGAGLGGRRAYLYLSRSFDVVAFVDNKVALQGTQIFNTPIISPEDMGKVDYDQVHIASMYYEPIYEQLTNTLCINADVIMQVDQSVIDGDFEVVNPKKVLAFGIGTYLACVCVISLYLVVK